MTFERPPVDPPPTSIRILRLPAVQQRTGEGRSTTYARAATGLMTPPVKLGPRASGWPEHEIDAILSARVAGHTDNEIRQLVDHLVRARKLGAKSGPPPGLETCREPSIGARRAVR